jgi:hypothetical protein
MPVEFRKANWTPDKLQAAKDEFDNIFKEHVIGERGQFNKRSVSALHEARFDLGELFIHIVEETFLTTNPLSLLVSETTGNLGDIEIFRQQNSALRMVNRAIGSKPISQRLTFREWNIVTSQKEVNVEIPLEKVAAGSITPSIVATNMAIAVLRGRISTALQAIDDAVDATPDRSGLSGFNLRYTGFTQSNLDNAIDGVMDEGGTPTVFGRHTTLAPMIRGFSGFGLENLDILTERGIIGSYHGANIVTIADEYNKYSADHIIRNDRIYVASGRKGAILKSVDVNFLNYVTVDERTATFMAGTRVDEGVLVWDKYAYRVITRS